MGDLTRQPETKLLTQTMQLRLVVDYYFWTPLLADTESIFYINCPEELPGTTGKVMGV